MRKWLEFYFVLARLRWRKEGCGRGRQDWSMRDSDWALDTQLTYSVVNIYIMYIPALHLATNNSLAVSPQFPCHLAASECRPLAAVLNTNSCRRHLKINYSQFIVRRYYFSRPQTNNPSICDLLRSNSAKDTVYMSEWGGVTWWLDKLWLLRSSHPANLEAKKLIPVRKFHYMALVVDFLPWQPPACGIINDCQYWPTISVLHQLHRNPRAMWTAQRHLLWFACCRLICAQCGW